MAGLKCVHYSEVPVLTTKRESKLVCKKTIMFQNFPEESSKVFGGMHLNATNYTCTTLVTKGVNIR